MADEQLNEKDLNVEETGAETTADARVLELEEQLAAAKDQSLRVAAEAQNSIRRAEQEVDKARKFALEKFSSDLLPVIDSLELALAHSSAEDEHVKQIREGVELTLKMFQDTLKRYNLEVVDPHGQPFNPDHHQAMAMQENAEVEPNSVLNVFQKGYLLNGRLLRPAMVVVSKAPSAAQPSINEKA
ncbi:nucleotide exchange factor GrpE [Pseudomonas monteilii]|jgi:molecular chaperone GrpE|uniref:Protein GrpE n=3 Tax=Pseudomonas TaxID=286 RepID=A0A6G6V4M6_9PSED|nr:MULTISPECIES: nucleotide exchange factor GrpE [Pseudomonas]MDR2316182.1 nucleotide exchange factor GrpE [Pseudomonas sp.]BAV03621.1 molecular chaperone GrpE [Pseudomonas sp. JNBP 4454]AVH36849.1 nucleotide exchange factor GrpE [Pseudomonas monteilii]MBA6140360.1 nucleotide exchange factor GrpE [Pseudomonas monteilii]MBI6920318.1 nucleotide exchange factor GrpE [Pseudomonas monteilii]